MAAMSDADIVSSVERGGAAVLADEDARFNLNELLCEEDVVKRLRQSTSLCQFLGSYPVESNDDCTMFCRLVRKLGDAEECASVLVQHAPVMEKLVSMALQNKKAMNALASVLERAGHAVPGLLYHGYFVDMVMGACTLPTMQTTIQTLPLLCAVFKGACVRRDSATGLYLTLLLSSFNSGQARASFFGEPPKLLRLLTLPEGKRTNVPEEVRTAHSIADLDVMRPFYSTVNSSRDARNTDAQALAALLVEKANFPPVVDEVMRGIGLLCKVMREEKAEKWRSLVGSKKEEQTRLHALERLDTVAFLYLQQNPRERRLVHMFLETHTQSGTGMVCVPQASAELSAADQDIHAFLRAHVHPITDCEKCTGSREDSSARAAFTQEGGRGRSFDARKRRCCSLYEHAVTQQDLVSKLSEYTSRHGSGKVMREKQKKQKVAAFMLSEHGVDVLGQQSTDFKVSLLGRTNVVTAVHVARGGKVNLGMCCRTAVHNNIKSVFMGFRLS
jgi:hypothetical protein